MYEKKTTWLAYNLVRLALVKSFISQLTTTCTTTCTLHYSSEADFLRNLTGRKLRTFSGSPTISHWIFKCQLDSTLTMHNVSTVEANCQKSDIREISPRSFWAPAHRRTYTHICTCTYIHIYAYLYVKCTSALSGPRVIQSSSGIMTDPTKSCSPTLSQSYTCVLLYICMYGNVYMYVFEYIFVCVLCVRVCGYVCVHIYICIYIYIYIYMYVYVYIYTCICIYIYMYIYICMFECWYMYTCSYYS